VQGNNSFVDLSYHRCCWCGSSAAVAWHSHQTTGLAELDGWSFAKAGPFQTNCTRSFPISTGQLLLGGIAAFTLSFMPGFFAKFKE
jgi:hypothetical protein